MEYTVFKFDGSQSSFSLSYSELREQHERFCGMVDEKFMAHLADAAHVACVIGFLKELGAEATIGDAGIVHELIHLITIPEHVTYLPAIREQFREVLRLA